MTPSGFCPNPAHSLIAILLSALVIPLPPATVSPFSVARRFPGTPPAHCRTISVERTFTLEPGSWHSTGLWLSAGSVGTIVCESPRPDITIQIGAHQETLLAKPGPWLRWPFVVTFRPLDSCRMQIASPFGGPVYVVVSSLPADAQRTLTLQFDGFLAHPFADINNPAIWEQTKEIPVPWGELVTTDVVFTLPSQNMKKLDFDLIDRNFRPIVKAVREYLSVEFKAPYRFVFDVELPPEFSTKYPLTLLVADVPFVLDNWGEVCGEFFRAVVLLCTNSMRDNVLDPLTERAVMSIAATVGIQTVFTNFDPRDLEFGTLPEPLFSALWEVQQHRPRLIPDTLAAMRESAPHATNEMWLAFVGQLCKTAQIDFTPLLEQSRPIPLNLSQSLQGLPRFVPLS
jgi:hypothetical protein